VRFLSAYHEVYPLTEAEVRFIPEAYRFFILNYVIREGKRFFRPDLCARFRTEAATMYLPDLNRLDITPLLKAIRA
jgi:Ser/Thr protein kinase RdoA (MazF antagonist)